jgi:excinuclease ABC subunit C
MKNDPKVSNIFDLEGRRYPHMKLTSERFPRVLATRAIEDDDAEYFGAFLPKTAVRIMIDYLNRRFRLRSCDIDIDGTFTMPCTQYYRRRCVAPCVAKLCSPQRYAERVELVRFFLANDRAGSVR